MLNVIPSSPLNFDEQLTLSLSAGVLDLDAKPLVWRDMRWTFTVEEQRPGGFIIYPRSDSTDQTLNMTMTFTFGIRLDPSTLRTTLRDLDRAANVPILVSTIADSVNWSDSGRTDTTVTLRPAILNYSTRYSLIIHSGLKDGYGRSILDEDLMSEFRTMQEPDRDGDNVTDSRDAFPDDPTEWSDRDGDGYGDNKDRFPDDGDEHLNTDGDGIGDNEDNDDDNDGMPDIWESEHGLDHLDPNDAFLDPDRDGHSNLEEYLSGTDPKDDKSKPVEEDNDLTSVLVLVGLIILILLVIAIGASFILSRSRGAGSRESRKEE
jgi:hypothetical protein